MAYLAFQFLPFEIPPSWLTHVLPPRIHCPFQFSCLSWLEAGNISRVTLFKVWELMDKSIDRSMNWGVSFNKTQGISILSILRRMWFWLWTEDCTSEILAVVEGRTWPLRKKQKWVCTLVLLLPLVYPTSSPLSFSTCKTGIKIFSLKWGTTATSYTVAQVTAISQ